MEKTTFARSQKSVNGIAWGLLTAAVLCMALSSPREGLALLAWISPVCLLAFFRLTATRKKALWALPALFIAHFLSDYNVAPFPLPVILIFGAFQSLEQVAVYLADRWVTKRVTWFGATLFFPSSCVAVEFLNTAYGGGIWWSVANSQYPFPWLTQLASITGMWGISFLLYWTASVAVWAIGRYREKGRYRSGLAVCGCILAVALVFGYLRYAAPGVKTMHKVRTAGVAVPLVNMLETIYKDYSGRKITVDPRASVTDPVLRLVARAEGAFVESTDSARFGNSLAAMRRVNDSLFSLSRSAADSGASIICWSEGNAVIFKADEAALLERGKCFARKNKVYLLMALCVVHPGQVTPGKKYLENEAVLAGSDGRILTVFHKNNPVPMVEACQAGDGHIPVLETSIGRIAVSICYDADLPLQMHQLSRKHAGLLLLPSGDWYAISPFHTYMAVYRGVENGCSVFREVSNGLSIATDYRGRPAGSFDYFKEGAKLWLADLPVGRVDTVYSRIGDVLAYGCLLITGLTILTLPAFRIRGAN